MANPLLGEVTVELGGKPYTLVYDVNGACVAEDAMGGVSTNEMMDRFTGNRLGMLGFRAIIFGAMQRHHAGSSPSLEATGRLLAELPLSKIQQLVFQVLRASLGAAEEGDGGDAATGEGAAPTG